MGVPGEVDDKGFAYKSPPSHKSPESAVIAAIPVVTHDEVMAGWDHYGSIIVPGLDSSREKSGVCMLNVRLS